MRCFIKIEFFVFNSVCFFRVFSGILVFVISIISFILDKLFEIFQVLFIVLVLKLLMLELISLNFELLLSI